MAYSTTAAQQTTDEEQLPVHHLAEAAYSLFSICQKACLIAVIVLAITLGVLILASFLNFDGASQSITNFVENFNILDIFKL